MNINVNQSPNSDSTSTELEDLMNRASEKRDKRSVSYTHLRAHETLR